MTKAEVVRAIMGENCPMKEEDFSATYYDVAAFAVFRAAGGNPWVLGDERHYEQFAHPEDRGALEIARAVVPNGILVWDPSEREG